MPGTKQKPLTRAKTWTAGVAPDPLQDPLGTDPLEPGPKLGAVAKREDHPLWSTFKARLFFLPQEELERAWDLTRAATEDQAVMNERGLKRSENALFQELTELLRPFLRVPPGKTLALWSGGFAVSEYAQSKGYITLEATHAGKAYDTLGLKQFEDWAVLGSLWNHISKAFTQEYQAGEVHVFVRVFDFDSVLLRQEIPNLHPDLQQKVLYHILADGPGGKIREIDPLLELCDLYCYDDPNMAYETLRAYLDEHPEEVRAREKMILPTE